MNIPQSMPILAALLTAASLAFADDTPLLVVWNGEDANRGSGWAGANDGKNFIKPQTDIAFSGDTALELRREGAGWLGAGWNWHAWWPADAGTDITPYTHLVFRLKQTSGDAEGFLISLGTSSKTSTQVLPIADYLPRNARLQNGEWHKLIIPLADFKSHEDDKPAFDPATVWEITFGSWSEDERSFTLFVDDISFEKREPKIEW